MRALQILATLNVSNPSNLDADSGFIFLRSLFRTLLNLEPEWKATILCPPGTPQVHPNAKLLPLINPSHKYQARFDFPWSEYAEVLGPLAADLDLLYVNQPELLANLLALIQSIRGRRIASVAYVHYLAALDSDHGFRHDQSLNDWGIGASVLRRQCEVLEIADRIVVGSHYAAECFKRVASTILGHEVERPIDVVSPPSEDLRGLGEADFPDLPFTIIYNHRLYAHYGAVEFLDWATEFARGGNETVRVMATDPTSGRDSRREKFDPSPTAVRSQLEKLPFAEIRFAPSRAEYYTLLRKAHVGLAPFRSSPFWSMSCVDVMAAGRPLLAPRSGPFIEMLGDNRELLYSDTRELSNKATALLRDKEKWIRLGEFCQDRSHVYSERETAKKLGTIFRNVTDRRID